MHSAHHSVAKRAVVQWAGLVNHAYNDLRIDDVTPSPLLRAVTGASTFMSERICFYLTAAGFHPGVLAYGGYASTTHARFLGRALMTFSEDQRVWLNSRRGWRQFFDAQIPFQPVFFEFGQASCVAFADAQGFLDINLGGHGLKPGWHPARLRAISAEDVKTLDLQEGDSLTLSPMTSQPDSGVHHSEGGEATPQLVTVAGKHGRIRTGKPVTCMVRVISDDERLGVVCDIDDTIMVSNMPRMAVAARNAFLVRPSDREAVPGMAHLLRVLAQEGLLQVGGASHAPVIYLSTGAWNVMPTLRDFLHRLHFPEGACLMTNWGPSHTGWFRSGQEHKNRQLRQLVHTLPQLKWVLVGDDGQHDPEIYARFAREYPDHVAAIVIRSLTPMQQVMSHGSSLALRPDALKDVPKSVPISVGEDGNDLLRQLQPLLARNRRQPRPESAGH